MLLAQVPYGQRRINLGGVHKVQGKNPYQRPPEAVILHEKRKSKMKNLHNQLINGLEL
jgi:hypothetical protein